MKKFLLILLLSVITGSVFAQTRTITGTVVSSDKNEPLVGVTIQVKGNTTAAQTDVNGKYSIIITNQQNVVLTVKYVGYTYQEHTLRVGENNLDVKLVPAAETNLEDVVVVGYGTQKKIHLTGSVATVDTKQIQDIPAVDLASTLRGQVPGLSVSGGNTRPGANTTTLTIRNPVYYGKDATPTILYIIDDIFRDQAAFNALDQSEVESISVLKDAAAAIYGIAGTNGAIVVRTKRGRAGAPKISYNGTYGLSTITKFPTVLSGIEQAQFINDYYITPEIGNGNKIDEHGYRNGSATDKLRSIYTPDELEYIRNPDNNTDWLREAFQTATVQRHSLTITGGNEKVTYFAGTTYVNQNSNFKGANADRWTYRASVDARVANGLKVGISLSGNTSNDRKYYYKQGGESADNDFRTLLTAPTFTKYYINGLPALIGGPYASTGNTNLLENFNYFAAQNTNDYSLSKPTVLNINPTIVYDVPFVKGLRLTGNYNRQITNNFNKQIGTNYYLTQFAGLGENNHIPGGSILNAKVLQKNGDIVRLNPSYNNDYNLNFNVSYDHKFGKHQITLLGLYEQQERYTEGVDGRVEGVLDGGYDNQFFAIGAQTSTQSSLLSEFGRQAYAGRINYNYADKYLFEGLLRADGSTKFAPGKRWGYFPSFSAGWVVSEEGFFKNSVKFINLFKIRGSIGFLGSDATKPWLYAENYNFGQAGKTAVFGGNLDRPLAIFQNVALANPDARWDDITKTNVGLDFQLLKSRLSLTVDGFYDHRYNMLAELTSSSPLTVGAAVPTENYASVNNFGYELSATWRDKLGSNGTYYITGFVNWSDNKILKRDQAAGIAGTWEDVIGGSDDKGYVGYKYEGFFRSKAEVDAYLAAHPGYTINGVAPKPGMLYYTDIRGKKNAAAPGGYDGPDGIIDQNDRDYITHKASNHYGGGFNFGGSYKNFSVQVITTLSWGGTGNYEAEALNPIAGPFANATGPTQNRPSIWAPGNYWTYDNPSAELPAPYYVGKNGGNDLASSFWIKNSFQFRMTNLNVSYAIPKFITKKLGVSDVRVYTNIVNPVNFYNPYSYRDNGVSSYLTYPLVKSYTFGLNIGL